MLAPGEATNRIIYDEQICYEHRFGTFVSRDYLIIFFLDAKKVDSLNTLEKLIQPESDARLLDLYCGYGLIGLSLVPKVDSMIGIEIDGPSVKAAAASAEHLYRKKEIRFLRGEIGPALIRNRLPLPAEKELLVLDPPRSGTADDVIKELARRSPLRVVHVFCGTDVIPGSLAQWKNQGYLPSEIQPLDLFPGTPNMETMILLKKQ